MDLSVRPRQSQYTHRNTVCHLSHDAPPAKFSIAKRHSVATSSATRLPSLTDIIADMAPSPFTLTAFRSFVTQYHCLEVLDFILDIERYQRSYPRLAAAAAEQERQRLVDCYVRSYSPKEINLPCCTRDKILAEVSDGYLLPESLDPALESALDLLNDNVYIPFVAAMRAVSREPSPPLPESPQSMTLSQSSPASSDNGFGGYRTENYTTEADKVQIYDQAPDEVEGPRRSKVPKWKSTFKWLKASK